jgi:hypothetical protein
MPGKIKKATTLEISVVDNPANELAEIPFAKRLDPKAAKDAAFARFKKRVDKRLAEAKARFHDELSKIERGEPIEKKRKKRQVMAFTQENFEEERDKQPAKIGPGAHNDPASYPIVGKAATDAAADREARIAKAAAAYCDSVKSAGSTKPGSMGVDRAAGLSAYERYRKESLFDHSAAMNKAWKGDGPPVAVGPRDNVTMSNSYQALMKIAESAHDTDPSLSVAQHFLKIYTDPAYVELATADRNFDRSGKTDLAALALAKADGRTVPAGESDSDDGDDPDSADEGPDSGFDDSDEGTQELGPERGPRGGAGTQSGGKSTATYRGGHNTSHNSPSMEGRVRSSGSYNDQARSPSAYRRR